MNVIQELSGKTAFITGSSRGIGLASARLMHARGAHVIVHARQASAMTDALLAELGERVSLVVGDLAAAGGAESVWQQALSATPKIDILVNNAGAWLASDIHSDAAWQDGWHANIALNLTAPATLCRLALLHFQATGGGIIINMASRSSHRGDDAEHLAYGAAKGGLLALTKGIARGYGRDNVLAYAVAPGWVATDLADGAIEASVLANLPLGEVTPAQDVAEMIAFLASGRARHTTGATIDITGADYVR